MTDRLDNLFKSLGKTFDDYQRAEIEEKGYTFLEKHQLQKVLEGHGGQLCRFLKTKISTRARQADTSNKHHTTLAQTHMHLSAVLNVVSNC